MRTEILFASYTIINIFAILLIDHWLCRSSLNYRRSVGMRVIVCFLFAAAAFMPVLAVLLKEGTYKYYLLKYSYIWLGFFAYLGGLLLTATVLEVIIRLIARAGRHGSGSAEDEEDRKAAARHISALVIFLIFAALIGINVYGLIHGREVKLTHYDVKIEKQVKKTNKLRVALITDLHLSYNSSVKQIQKTVDMINREKPDVVFVGGDLFSSDYVSVRNRKDYIRAFRKIKAKEGVFWVYGNHDVEEPLFCGFGMEDPEKAKRTKRIVRFLKRSGFTILEDECTAVAGGEVQIAGRADAKVPKKIARKRLKAAELLDDLDKEKPILVLEHEPGDYKELAENGADISFSGHTHAGQIFPGTVFTRLMNDVVYGLTERNGMKVIVTSGDGCYGPPLRVLSDNEVVIADLYFKK